MRGYRILGGNERTIDLSGMPLLNVCDSRDDFSRYAQTFVNLVSAVWYVTSQKNGASAVSLQHGLGLGSIAKNPCGVSNYIPQKRLRGNAVIVESMEKSCDFPMLYKMTGIPPEGTYISTKPVVIF